MILAVVLSLLAVVAVLVYQAVRGMVDGWHDEILRAERERARVRKALQ